MTDTFKVSVISSAERGSANHEVMPFQGNPLGWQEMADLRRFSQSDPGTAVGPYGDLAILAESSTDSVGIKPLIKNENGSLPSHP